MTDVSIVRRAVVAAIRESESWRIRVTGQTEQRIGTAYSMPARCHTWLRVTESASQQGPQVAVLASLLLSEVQVKVVYRSESDLGGATDQIALTMPLVPVGERIAQPPRVLRAPTGGSTMSLQLFNYERTAMSEERMLGPCVDGVREVLLSTVARVDLVAWLSPRGPGRQPERQSRLDGEMVFLSACSARLKVRPSRPEMGGDEATLDVPLVHAGTTLHFRERIIERELPGITSTALTFLDGDGRPIGRERTLA